MQCASLQTLFLSHATHTLAHSLTPLSHTLSHTHATHAHASYIGTRTRTARYSDQIRALCCKIEPVPLWPAGSAVPVDESEFAPFAGTPQSSAVAHTQTQALAPACVVGEPILEAPFSRMVEPLPMLAGEIRALVRAVARELSRAQPLLPL